MGRPCSDFVSSAAAVRASTPGAALAGFRPAPACQVPMLGIAAFCSRIEIRLPYSPCPRSGLRRRRLLRPLLTSGGASRCLSTPVARGTPPDLPGYCAPTFTLMSVGSTPHHSVQVLGFACLCLLTRARRLLSASCPSNQRFAFSFFQTRGRPRNPCLRLTLPLAACVEDFHLPVGAPCRAHKGNAPHGAGRC